MLHLFCGIGGGALGFQRARAEAAGLTGRYRTIGAVDFSAPACRDFEALTGESATCADLATMTPAELRAACGGEVPDVVFTSPPCKGFSGLLSTAQSKTPKYQALNRLVLQGLWLTLEAFAPRVPRLILLENVPRIAQRGQDLLRQVKALLQGYGVPLGRADPRLRGDRWARATSSPIPPRGPARGHHPGARLRTSGAARARGGRGA